MKRILLIILIAVAIILTVYPLLRPGFFISDDGGWMVIRLSAFYQSLREGQFPVRFLGRLNYGYGYPVANFLYPGFMYIGSLIHLFGASFVDTVKIIMGGSVAIGTIFTYLWLRKYFSPRGSTIGALGYSFAPYLLFDLYRRGSVGEVFALAIAAMGMYSIAAKKKWLFGLTVPLLILSHNTLAFIFLVFFGLYITFLGEWRRYFLMFVAGVAMGAFFWLPALYERKYVIFDSIAVADPADYFITVQNGLLLGTAGIVAAGASLFKKKLYKKERKFFLISLGSVIFLTLPLSSFIWRMPLLTHTVQFPYRFLSLAIIAQSWLTAYVVDSLKKSVQLAFIVLVIGLGLWGVFSIQSSVIYTNEPEGYYSTNEATTTVADEYMPKWVSRKPTVHAYDRLLFYKGRGSVRVNTMSTQTIDVTVDAAEESVIQVNSLYYPGWGATLDDTKVRIDYSSDEGVMRIQVPAGNHHLVVAFRETISRFLADCVSLAGFVVYVIALFL
jgi:hypothetical protein